jgi:hypothetical protein
MKMVRKYEFSGRVRDSDKLVSCYVSAPLGIPTEEVLEREEQFYTAFDNVSVTIHYVMS